MKQNQSLIESLKRLAGPVDRSGVWATIEAKADGAKGQKLTAGAPQVRSRRARLAVYAVAALLLVAAAAIGTVFAVEHSQEKPGTGGDSGLQLGTDGALTSTTLPPAVDYSRGGQWKRLAVSSGGGRVSGLAINPMDTQVLYAVTEGGLYKTSDGAGIWSKILEFTGEPEIAVDPVSPSTVYVVFPLFDSPKLLRSDDGGASWTELDNSILLDSDYKMEFVWDGGGFGPPVTDGAMSVSTVYMDTDSGVWRSVDRGATWSKTTRDEMESKTVDFWGTGLAASPLGFYGETIEDAEDGTSAEIRDALADPKDPAVIYAGTTGAGVYKSVDGGTTWRRSSAGITATPVYALIPDPVSPSVLYALTQEGIQKSTNGGATWTAILAGGEYLGEWVWVGSGTRARSGGMASMVVSPSSSSILYAWNADGLLRSADGGSAWSKCAAEGLLRAGGKPTGNTGHLLLVSAADANIVFAQADGGMLRSADGGDTWTQFSGMRRSADGGDTWTEVSDMGEAWGLIADPSQPTVMYLTARMQLDPSLTPEQQAYDYHNNPDYRLFKSVDSGATWAPIFQIKEDRVGLTILFDSNDPARLYSPVYGDDSSGSGSRLMRSLDGGSTWEQVDFSGPGPSFNSLLFDPRSSDTVYARVQAKNAVDTLAGLYRSSDGGTTWKDIGRGPLGGASTFGLTVSPVDGTLYACSWSGLFKWVPND
jgi:hypothetical protein